MNKNLKNDDEEGERGIAVERPTTDGSSVCGHRLHSLSFI